MSKLSRRQFNKVLAGGAVAVPLSMLVSGRLRADELPMVDPEAATAKALQYVLVAPQEGINCASCSLYTGEESAANGPCSIFPNALVPAEAWCAAYQPKA